MEDDDRTASLMTPAKLAQLQVRPKPAASPAAWLDQLATDAGSGHARRLLDLRKTLEAQLRERGYAGARQALEALQGEAGKLDFGQLEPKGWLARATGKGKQEKAGFAAQAERIARSGEDLQDEVRALAKRMQAQVGAEDRTLMEFGVELKAIEKIIDQGARWLQDMRNQLKAREAEGAAPASMQEDAARCELLVARLKTLRVASSAAQQAAERCRTAAAQRAALLERLQQLLPGEWAAFQGALAPLADAARGPGSATGVDAAQRAGSDLQAALQQAAQDCAAQQEQEEALAGEIAAVQEPLQAAA
jgi:hypothetical protein